MNKNLKNTTIFTLLLAVVFLNITLDAQASELADKSALSSEIGNAAVANIRNSGNNTSQSTDTENSTTQNVQNNNDATINQNIHAVANTGHNIAERNISIGGNAGMISTDDAAVVTAAQLNINNNATVLGGNTNNSLTLSQLNNTGDNTATNTSADTKQLTAVQNNNKTTVIQNVDASTNTGENYAPRNISIGGQAGIIQTGNAYTGSSLLLAGNGNVALVGGENNGNGPGSGASVVLTNTGDRYRATNEFRDHSQTTIANHNLMSVAQACFDCTVNTGNNTSNRNINTKGSAGIIQTGNAIIVMSAGVKGNANASTVNNSDTNTLYTGNAANTGRDTNMSNNRQQFNNLTINNTNNSAVTQHMNAYANTGYNEASRNIALGGDAGVIKTGAAYIITLLNASTNQNVTQ